MSLTPYQRLRRFLVYVTILGMESPTEVGLDYYIAVIMKQSNSSYRREYALPAAR